MLECAGPVVYELVEILENMSDLVFKFFPM